MAAPLQPDTSPTSGGAPILARCTDGRNIAIFNGAKGSLPAAEWFEVSCDDAGRIVLTPAPTEAVPAAAHSWAQEKDRLAAALKPRPYAHVASADLKNVPGITQEEVLDELRARGILVKAWDGPPPLKPRQPVSPPVPPGALERFLKERG